MTFFTHTLFTVFIILLFFRLTSKYFYFTGEGVNENNDDTNSDQNGSSSGGNNPQGSDMAGALPKFGLGTGTFTLPPLKKSTLGGVVTIKMPALPVRKSKATQEQWSCNYHCALY